MSETKLIVSPSPHVHSKDSTERLMTDVLIALAPAWVVSIVVYGWRVAAVTLFSVACCMLIEWLIRRFMLGERKVGCLSAAAVTGVLLAFNLPVNISFGLVAIGCLVAIGVAKMSFGGLGKNPFNPALVARVFMLIAFPVAMTTFPAAADAVSGATPLSLIKEGIKNGQPIGELIANWSWSDMLLGIKSGSMGEISAAALLLGFVWLLCRRVITWHIPVAVLGTMAIFGGIMYAVDPTHYLSPMYQVLTGGAVLGAVFMATDYVTSPMAVWGKIVFGVGIGLITMLIRFWGPYPEGMSFAILIMNSVVPLIDKGFRPKRFGTGRVATK